MRLMLMLLLCSCSSNQTWTLVDPIELPAVSKYPLLKTNEYEEGWARISAKDPISEKEESLLTKKKCHVRASKSKNSTSIAIVKANNNILVTRSNDQWYAYQDGYIHEYCFRSER
jgi:hypothetical protein